MRDVCYVEPGEAADLLDRPTDAKPGYEKAEGLTRLQELNARLIVLQNRLWAEHRRSVLLVLQGLDASGKDGTIRRVFTGLNPQGCRVVSFREPSHLELDHDYLWRIHGETPKRGEIGIFNRSHYEDVTTVQVLGLIDDAHRQRRYRQINEFERMLTEEGTSLVKVFLNIGNDEQRRRLQSRLDNPEKRWKFRVSDLDTRAKWKQYLELYDLAITATSTKWAPWYVVPADRKWVSGLTVAELLVDTLQKMDPEIPPASPELDGMVVE